jgi:hypothetical protein
MENRRFIWLLLTFLMLGVLILSACGSTPEATPTVTETQTEAEDVEPTSEDTADLPEMTAEPEVVSECIVCHQDQETLINTADPVEEEVEENEGAG